MRIERRCIPRKRPGGISYFEFEKGSGGIVLDASEKGLAFQAADAVQQLGPRRIYVSPYPEERIELNGDVVWTDRSKKTGGLRFTDLAAESCNLIRDWLKQPGESGASRQGQRYPHPAPAFQGVPDIPPGGPRLSILIPSPPPMQARDQRPVEPRPAPILPPLLHPDLTWPPEDSGVRRGFLHYLATGFLIAVFGLACVALAENFGFVGNLRPKVAHALIRLGETLNGARDSRSRDSSLLPALAEVPSPPPPALKSIPDASSGETLASSDPVRSSAPDSSGTPRLAAPPTKEDAYHPAYSRTPRVAQRRSVEASRLWSAVGAGSLAAAVDLARLYLEGDGVPRSCEQARILLRAAAKRGSREAREQLQKLRAYGCP